MFCPGSKYRVFWLPARKFLLRSLICSAVSRSELEVSSSYRWHVFSPVFHSKICCLLCNAKLLEIVFGNKTTYENACLPNN
jgi:hypothetical protein